MRALSAELNKKVLVVVPMQISEYLVRKGWTSLDYGGAEVVILPTSADRRAYVEKTRNAAAHTFSGLGAYPAVKEAMQYLLQGDHRHVAILSESWDQRGFRGALRSARFQSRSGALKRVDTLFTIGRDASRQFRKMGVPAGKIIPFGYFVDSIDPPRIDSRNSTPHFVYVGTLDEWKDPHAAVDAVARLPNKNWRLTVVGAGRQRNSLESYIHSRGVVSQVDCIRSMENHRLRELIAASDVLVLPSKYDGWGAVVNEALMAGTPAIVSTASGASELIVSELQGSLVRPGHPQEITDALIRSGIQTPGRRESLRYWAARHLSPRVAAEYFLRAVARESDDSMAHPPWRNH